MARGVAKRVAYKKESAFGTLAGAAGAKVVRRVTADFNLEKELYQSNELRPDYQASSNRHGVRSATGSIEGELSPGNYADFMASVVAKDFATGASATGLTVTIAASGNDWTIARTAGSWVTDGFFVGNVIRLSGGTLNALNLTKNFVILSVTALTLTVRVPNGSLMFAQAGVASVTATVQGKTTMVPTTGHTDDSYTIEQFYADIAQSEVFTGMKVNSVALSMPTTGFATVSVGFTGKDLTQTGTSAYFTSPTAALTTAGVVSVNGVVLVDGATAGCITQCDLTIERATENIQCVGSNSISEILTGKVMVSGNLSVTFNNAFWRDRFSSETVSTLSLMIASSAAADASFIALTIGGVKFNTFSNADAELNIVGSLDFSVSPDDITGVGIPVTSIFIQDSNA